MIQTTQLGNGLSVVTERMPDACSIALSFWVGTGSRDEVAGEEGLSHFLEHSLFKGAGSRSAFEIAQIIDDLGGDMNAFTMKDATAFYVRVLSDDVEVALDVLCDIMCDPTFEQKEIDVERTVILEEMAMRNDEPGELAHEFASEILFANHSLGREILGKESVVRSADATKLRAFFDHHYRPRNIVFSAAGALDHDSLTAGIEKRWHKSHGGSHPVRSAPSYNEGVSKHFVRTTDQMHVVFDYPAPDRHHSDRYAASIIDMLLGSGMASRLYQEVRERRGLAYSVYSSYTPHHDAGQFEIYAGVNPARTAETVDVIQAVIDEIKLGRVGEAELARAKRHLRTTTALGLEDTSARMSRNGRSLLQHGNVLSVDEVLSRIDAVSLSDLARVAASIFEHQPDKIYVGPKQYAICDY